MLEILISAGFGMVAGIALSALIVHFHYKKTGCYECEKIKKVD